MIFRHHLSGALVLAGILALPGCSKAKCDGSEAHDLLGIARDTVGLTQQDQLDGISAAIMLVCPGVTDATAQAETMAAFKQLCGSHFPCRTRAM